MGTSRTATLKLEPEYCVQVPCGLARNNIRQLKRHWDASCQIGGNQKNHGAFQQTIYQRLILFNKDLSIQDRF